MIDLSAKRWADEMRLAAERIRDEFGDRPEMEGVAEGNLEVAGLLDELHDLRIAAKNMRYMLIKMARAPGKYTLEQVGDALNRWGVEGEVLR